MPHIGSAGTDILHHDGEPIGAIGDVPRHPEEYHDRYRNNRATPGYDIDCAPSQACHNERRHFPYFQVHCSGPGRTHGHKFLSGGRVNPDGAVKVSLGSTHFHRDSQTLTDFASVGTYHVSSQHPVGIGIDH